MGIASRQIDRKAGKQASRQTRWSFLRLCHFLLSSLSAATTPASVILLLV